MSNLEIHVANILNQNKIKYISEKTFSDFRNGKYRFDFYIPDLDIAIEVNGLQHYLFTSHFYKRQSDFTKAQERDRAKISYCLAHKLKLYCIPCWDVYELKTFQDLTQDKFFARSKFHNDIVWKKKSVDTI